MKLLLTNIIWWPHITTESRFFWKFSLFFTLKILLSSAVFRYFAIFFYYYICLPFCRDSFPPKNYPQTRKWIHFCPNLSTQLSAHQFWVYQLVCQFFQSIDLPNTLANWIWSHLTLGCLSGPSHWPKRRLESRGIHKVNLCCLRWGNISLVDQHCCYTWVARDTPLDSIRFRLAWPRLRFRIQMKALGKISTDVSDK